MNGTVLDGLGVGRRVRIVTCFCSLVVADFFPERNHSAPFFLSKKRRNFYTAVLHSKAFNSRATHPFVIKDKLYKG